MRFITFRTTTSFKMIIRKLSKVTMNRAGYSYRSKRIYINTFRIVVFIFMDFNGLFYKFFCTFRITGMRTFWTSLLTIYMIIRSLKEGTMNRTNYLNFFSSSLINNFRVIILIVMRFVSSFCKGIGFIF